MRGTVLGEKVQSQAQNKAFDEGWKRMIMQDDGERGRFVYDKVKKCLVRAGEETDPRALDAPIMAGRFYENVGTMTVGEDGKPKPVDLGSRQRYNQHLKANGLTHTSDYGLGADGKIKEGTYWDRKEQEKKELVTTGGDHKERREQIGRTLYEVEQRQRRNGR